MFYKFGFFSICIIFLYSSFVFPQDEVNVSGTVLDAQTMERLAGANLIIEELNLGTTSDETGNFLFSEIPQGKYIISTGYIGYHISKQDLITQNTTQISLTIRLIPTILKGQSIEVTATRALEGESPISFSNITRKDLDEQYTASDVPLILDELPGVYSYSLTGDNLGYTFLKIRGFDQSRIGVMINDIPLNDPEDQQVYWVDHPDLAESVEDIQVQRGVGSSVYGTSTFGGSVNIKTKKFSSRRMAKITYGSGSFNTRKMLAEFNSGVIKNTYAFHARFSKIDSDGYRKYSSSNLISYYLGMERYDRNMVTQLNIFDGHERTHPDWDGIPENILRNDRRYKRETYKNAVDDFRQPQIHLINTWQITNNLNFTNTLYLIHGEGYYENLKINKDLTEFGMEFFVTRDPNLFGTDSLSYYESVGDSALFQTGEGNYIVKKTDLTRQKWVNKNQYGWIGKLALTLNDAILTLGGSFYTFRSNHHGKVLWAKQLHYNYSPERNYYKYNGEKTNLSLYANYLYDIYPKVKLLANMLYEHKAYSFRQRETALFTGAYLNHYDVSYDFYSPRMGLNFDLSENLNVYGNISYAQREPTDNELFDTWTGPDDWGATPLFAKYDTVKSGGQVQYVKWDDPLVESEKLVDYEAGIAYNHEDLAIKANFYYMDFSNEIVPLGNIDKDGNPIKGNADKTVHSGIELSAVYSPGNYIKFNGNLSWSKNYYKKFYQQNYMSGTDDLSGNTIIGFPEVIANLRITGLWENLRGSLIFKYVGKQYLDNAFQKDKILDSVVLPAPIINPFTRIDLMLDYRIQNIYYFPEIRFIVKINNLFNELYETAGYYDSWAGMAYLYPAAVRNYYAAISFSL
jgi:iron complex outermembrane receptor protein